MLRQKYKSRSRVPIFMGWCKKCCLPLDRREPLSWDLTCVGCRKPKPVLVKRTSLEAAMEEEW